MATWERTPAPVEIHLLGPLQLRRNGQAVTEGEWGIERAKVLLAYLLWKGSFGASRAELSLALWPDRPVDEVANVFHVTVHRLRKVLEPELRRARDSGYIRHDSGRYYFEAQAPHRLDVTTFKALAADSAPEALQQAVTLYRGSYLEDVAWVLPPEVEIQRRRLEQLYVDALRRLTAPLDGYEAIPYLEKLLAVEPIDEAAQVALVSTYLSRGRLGLARRQVVRWRQALAELSLDPSPQTRTLWARVEGED